MRKISFVLITALLLLTACLPTATVAPLATPVAPAPVVETRIVIITGDAVAPAAAIAKVSTELIIKDSMMGVSYKNASSSIMSAELYIPNNNPELFQVMLQPGETLRSESAHSLRVWIFEGHSFMNAVAVIKSSSLVPLYGIDGLGNLVLIWEPSTTLSGDETTTTTTSCVGRLGDAGENSLTAVPAECWAVVNSWGPKSQAPKGQTLDVILKPGTAFNGLKGSVWLYVSEEAAKADLLSKKEVVIYYPPQ